MSGATSAAIIGGAAIAGAGATIYASNQAAGAQEDAQNKAIAAQQGFYNQSQQTLQPYINTGNQAAQKISALEGLNGADTSGIQATLASLPGYQFANAMGLTAQQNSATSRGLGNSGQAQYEQANLATQLANQYYNNYLSGLQNTENTGANAAGGLANAATTTGQGIAGSASGVGKAQAASDFATSGAIGSGAQGISTGLIANQLLQNQGVASGGSYLAQGGMTDSGFNNYLNNMNYGQIGGGANSFDAYGAGV